MSEVKRKTADALDVVRRLQFLTDRVVVFFSCGKDSAALAELCSDYFSQIALVYMYHVPGLSFHESYLAFWKARLGRKLAGGEIVQMPHWNLSRFLAASWMRGELHQSADVPRLSIRDSEVEALKRTGIDWFAQGQKKADSLERRAMLNKCSGIMLESHRAFPLADWKNRTVTQFLRDRDIPLSPEYTALGRSFDGCPEDPVQLLALREAFPEDYKRVLNRFPYAEALVFKHECDLKAGKGKKTKREA